MLRLLGATLLIMALVTAVLPQFTTCESQGKAITLANGTTVPMKCKWTARAELGIAVPILAVGVLMTTASRKESSRNLSILGAILGIAVLLIPTTLIGVCQSLMLCHTVMQPALLTTGSIILAASLAGWVVSSKSQKS